MALTSGGKLYGWGWNKVEKNNLSLVYIFKLHCIIMLPTLIGLLAKTLGTNSVPFYTHFS